MKKYVAAGALVFATLVAYTLNKNAEPSKLGKYIKTLDCGTVERRIYEKGELIGNTGFTCEFLTDGNALTATEYTTSKNNIKTTHKMTSGFEAKCNEVRRECMHSK
jgi:hypothetical protein